MDVRCSKCGEPVRHEVDASENGYRRVFDGLPPAKAASVLYEMLGEALYEFLGDEDVQGAAVVLADLGF